MLMPAGSTTPKMTSPNIRRPNIILVGVAALLPSVGVLVPSFIWILAALAALLVAGMALIERRRMPLLSNTIILSLVLLLVWAGVSTHWSLAQERAQSVILKATLFLAGGLLLITVARTFGAANQRWFDNALIAGFLVALALILFEIIMGAPVSRWIHGDERAGAYGLAFFNRSSSVLVLLTWPFVLVTYHRLGLAFALGALIASVTVLAILNTAAPLLAILLSGAAVGLILIAPRLITWMILFVTLVSIILSPAWSVLAPEIFDLLLVNNLIEQGLNHRFVIWGFASERLLEHPLFGWGLDSSRAIPGGLETIDITVNSNGDISASQFLPLHPHNGFLQIWLELGVVGAILAAVLVVALLKSILFDTRQAANRAFVTGAYVATFILFQLSFGVWQSWWIGVLWLTAAITVAAARHNPKNP